MSEDDRKISDAGQSATRESNDQITDEARGLAPLHVKGTTIGHVDEIRGGGGVEVPGFVPTKHELLRIVRYWATEIIDLDFRYFLYTCTGSSEWRTREFANRRLSKIASFVGAEEVRKAFSEAEETYARNVGERPWRIFKEGTAEEQQRYQEEVQERLAGRRDRKADAPRYPGFVAGSCASINP